MQWHGSNTAKTVYSKWENALGLAIKEKGVLVTFDKAIQYMAGAEFSQNVLILE